MSTPQTQPLTPEQVTTCASLAVAYTHLVADGHTTDALAVYIELHELEDGY